MTAAVAAAAPVAARVTASADAVEAGGGCRGWPGRRGLRRSGPLPLPLPNLSGRVAPSAGGGEQRHSRPAPCPPPSPTHALRTSTVRIVVQSDPPPTLPRP